VSTSKQITVPTGAIPVGIFFTARGQMIPLHNGSSTSVLTRARGVGNGLTDSAVAVLMATRRVRLEQSVTKHKLRYHPFGVPG